MKPLNILVIEDETVICQACELVLSEKGHSVVTKGTGKAGVEAIHLGRYDILLLDMKLPDMDGMAVLNLVSESKPEMCVIIMTGYSSISNAVQAIKQGADDYLAKPFTDDELLQSIEASCVSQMNAKGCA